jgi:hypothetical protein
MYMLDGLTPRSIKTYYNQAARVAGVHLRWRRGDNPIAAQVVAEPTSEELRAESKRLATQRRLGLKAMPWSGVSDLVNVQDAVGR